MTDGGPDTTPERAGIVPPPLTVTVAAAGSAAAGLVHATAAGTHSGDRQLVVLFALTAVAQLAWGAVAIVRPTRAVLMAGVALNGAAVLAWVLSRSFGLPVIDSLSQPEEVGAQDLIAAVLGGLAAFGALLAVVNPVRRAANTIPAFLAGAAVFALAVPAMAVEHTHGASHAHSHGEETAEDGGDARGHGDGERNGGEQAHDHGSADGTGEETGEAGTGPIISLDDPRVTPEQQAAAQNLIDTTTAAMAQFTDKSSVEAAGYSSIGDGRTGFEHFVNFGYLTDGINLDPTRVESIVFQADADGTRQIVSAMYILGIGQTMADVPDIAGELTAWHDHQDLCWDGNGRVVGLFRNGRCRPAGTLLATPPMLHVWMVENECGPFAGIEGHGGGCASHDDAEDGEQAAGD